MVEDVGFTACVSVFVVWQVWWGGEPIGLGWVRCLCGLICRKDGLRRFLHGGRDATRSQGAELGVIDNG